MFVGDGSHPLDRQYRMGSPFGIPLYFHITLFIFAAFYILTSLVPFRPSGMFFPVILVLSVYLHELGHALTSGHFGSRPRRIVLHMFGGVAEVPPTMSYRQELWVIANGPLVSLALAVIGYVLMVAFQQVGWFFGYALAYQLCLINGILFVFNVLPIYPLDGGQFFRQWMAMRVGKQEAIRRTLPLSMFTLIVMGVVSILVKWIGFLGIFIAIALFMVNHQEWQRWQHLFTKGFWNYLWPFGGKGKGGGSHRNFVGSDRWPGEKSEPKNRSGGGPADQFYVWWNRKQAEQLMRKTDEVGVFQLSPKERAILERYLDAKIRIKEKKQLN